MPPSPPIHTVAIGELLWDLIPAGPRLGGTTTNFAVLSARLGDSAALISCIGDDPLGQDALRHLQNLAPQLGPDAPLDLSAIQVSPSLPTGTVAVTLDPAGRPQYEITSPVAWDAITITTQASELASSAAVLCFGTLAQRQQLSRDSIRALILSAPPTCVRVCDLNLRAPFCVPEVLRWCLAHSDVLKVSDEELPEVARLLDDPSIAPAFATAPDEHSLTQSATASARALLALAPHCRLVAVTLGPHGSLLADRHETSRHIGFVVKVRDTIGAGDAFTAGLVYAFLRGASLARISEVSNLCGSYVASQQGATPEIPQELLKKIRSAAIPA